MPRVEPARQSAERRRPGITAHVSRPRSGASRVAGAPQGEAGDGELRDGEQEDEQERDHRDELGRRLPAFVAQSDHGPTVGGRRLQVPRRVCRERARGGETQ